MKNISNYEKMPYVLFEANKDFSLVLLGGFDGYLEFSQDGMSWDRFTREDICKAQSKAGKLFIRGIMNTYCDGKDSCDETCNEIIADEDIEITVSGNIFSLLDYTRVESGKEPIMHDGAFDAFFTRFPIVDASCLTFPSKSVSEACFANLFYECRKLVKGPSVLPATELSEECYHRMFDRCESLLEAPELPAMELGICCYDSMFLGCKSLESAPKLPADKLEYCCYASMFYACESLKEAPELPATTLAMWCYDMMFSGCTSLEKVPGLPATTLEEHCYNGMFCGCESLESAPELPATTLAACCYAYMFRDCTSLQKAPALPAINMADDCYHGMFIRCKSLEEAPALPATKLAKSCYNFMFFSCEGLKVVPDLPATELVNDCYNKMFAYCSNLKISEEEGGVYNRPYTIPADNEAKDALNDMFTDTGGPYKGTIVQGKTYYLKNADFTEEEEALCTLLRSGYLARERSGALNHYKDKPVKGKRHWKGERTIKNINVLFPQCEFRFITRDDIEPWKI